MKQEFIIKRNNPNLLIFFAGWGMDAHPFMECHPTNYDFMICYDYRSLQFDATILKHYQCIDIVAWSMGVWAATQAQLPENLPYGKRIAINGTTYPINDETGIPTAIFNGTLISLSKATLTKFQRRMCGNIDNFKYFQLMNPHRSLESLRVELAAIGNQFKLLPPKSFHWDEAHIGLEDRIFPPQNQQEAWQMANVKITIGNEAHYDKQIFINYLETIWTKS